MNLGITMPCYNSIKFLKKTLLSVTPLREQGCQINAVDSGSDDGTLELLKKYKIKTHYCKPGNMYEAVNLGISKLDTQWISYINSDDLLYKENIINFFKKNSEKINKADILCGNVKYIDFKDKELKVRTLFKPELVRQAILNGQPILPQPGTFFKKNVFEKLQGFDTNFKFSADYDFFIRSFKEDYKLFFDSRFTLAGFRIHEDQFSNKEEINMFSETDKILKKNNLKRNKFLFFYLRSLLFFKNINF